MSLGLLGVAIYYRVLTDMDLGERAVMEALVVVLRRIADFDFCPSWRRYLHQGC